MKTIIRFSNALGTLFQVTNIGAYFAPLFRPMVTEPHRLHPIRIMPDPARPFVTEGSQTERTNAW